MKLLLMLLLFVLCSPSLAQTTSKGVITGRVISDEGAGLPGMTVRLKPTSASKLSQIRSTSTDDEGNFRFDGLTPQVYSAEVSGSRAYVPAPKSAAERAEPRQVRIGESLTLTMIRGGVITGRVTNSNGEGLIAMPMQAILVRDAYGNPVSVQSYSPQTGSDDRGTYRFFGLTPGTYIVLANYGNPYWNSQASLYDGEAPTYYPSSTRDTAVEIQAISGGEVTGVDIKYRGERGHAISGKLTGAKESVNVELLHVGTQAVIATKYVSTPRDGGGSFDFFGVTDGDYEIIASEESSEIPAASPPRRVTVRGADVTGMDLRLMPLATIAGRVVIETTQTVCDKPARAVLEEIIVTARSEEKPRGENDPVSRPNSAEAIINDKGEFELRKLNPVRYRLALNLPNENLFLKSLSQTTANAKTGPAADIGRGGVLLKQGEKISGVTVTLTEGAASLRGKLSYGKERPSRLRVYLIPAETTAADDLLRYSEKIVIGDGAFAFTNLTPGKYLLLARAVADNEPADRLPSPTAWDANERAKLRKEAEAAKNEIELKPCQRVKDYVLKF